MKDKILTALEKKEARSKLQMIRYYDKVDDEDLIYDYLVSLLDGLNLEYKIDDKDFISLKELTEIIKMDTVLHALDCYGITTKKGNHKKYVQKYIKLRQYALELFGIQLPKEYPFSNPVHLLQEIEYILRKYLDTEQRKSFYDFTGIRVKVMKSDSYKSKKDREEFREFLLASIPTDEEMLNYYSLSDEEHKNLHLEDSKTKAEFHEILKAEEHEEEQERAIVELAKRLKYTPS